MLIIILRKFRCRMKIKRRKACFPELKNYWSVARNKMKNYNYIWAGILFLSLVGGFFLIKTAYANPLDLPSYAMIKPDIKEAYSFAKMSSDKLTGLPCNCGCGTDAAGHGGRLHSRGLIDCFMNGDVNNLGKWDAHASECGLCYEDALYAKGLYEKARQGIIKDFTGISSPYEEPEAPEIIVESHVNSIEESVDRVIQYLKENQLI